MSIRLSPFCPFKATVVWRRIPRWRSPCGPTWNVSTDSFRSLILPKESSALRLERKTRYVKGCKCFTSWELYSLRSKSSFWYKWRTDVWLYFPVCLSTWLGVKFILYFRSLNYSVFMLGLASFIQLLIPPPYRCPVENWWRFVFLSIFSKNPFIIRSSVASSFMVFKPCVKLHDIMTWLSGTW